MRSILMAGLIAAVVATIGCADLLGIEPWEDKPMGEGVGTGGAGGAGGATNDMDPPAKGYPCGNGVQDGKETGVDCGGGECRLCDEREGCLIDADCISGYCPATRGYCITDTSRGLCGVEFPENPTCGDCIKNGLESDIDCGGECFPCRVGQVCTNDSECWSGVCMNGACKTGATKTRCFSNGDCATGICAHAASVADCMFESCCQ